ncbi:MAG: hypothetical protein KGL39_46005 [Patescibacteria group bacterium]|nr:hypothetical protein [Patescibacteria group bacterium]
MADMPGMAAAPAPDDDTDQDTAPDTDTGDQGDESPDVLVTIAKGPDGGYLVYDGDEPDEGGADTGEDESGADMEAGAAAGADAGAPPAAPAPAGPAAQHCDSIGSALKAALDILRSDENGEGEAAFHAGFAGGSGASPSKPMMPQKHTG